MEKMWTSRPTPVTTSSMPCESESKIMPTSMWRPGNDIHSSGCGSLTVPAANVTASAMRKQTAAEPTEAKIAHARLAVQIDQRRDGREQRQDQQPPGESGRGEEHGARRGLELERGERIDLRGLAQAVERDDEREAHGDLGRGDGDDEEDEDLAVDAGR